MIDTDSNLTPTAAHLIDVLRVVRRPLDLAQLAEFTRRRHGDRVSPSTVGTTMARLVRQSLAVAADGANGVRRWCAVQTSESES